MHVNLNAFEIRECMITSLGYQFHEDAMNGFEVIIQKPKCDGKMDGQKWQNHYASILY